VRQLLASMVLSVTVLLSMPADSAAQDARVAASNTSGASTVNLAFSKDGHRLREIQSVSSVTPGNFWSVRAITYDATKGSMIHSFNFEPDAWFFSATSDGRSAIISINRDRQDAQVHLLMVDMDTGKTEVIPSKWFDPEDDKPYSEISADGRLVSAYTESNLKDGQVVTLYDWPTKRLVAKQLMGYPAGGISWGGVTADGKIEFLNNRSGGDVVDPQTGRVLLSVGPRAQRSLDGSWVVDFPNLLYGDAPRKVLIKNGMNGRVVGKLDVQIKDEEEKGKWAWARGAFCGTTGSFVAATKDTVQVFALPSGKKVAEFPAATWQDVRALKTDPTVTVACSSNARRVAIRSGSMLTLHALN